MMPELIALLPCEKVIEDKSGNVTIVTVLDTMEMVAPLGEQVPDDGYVAQNWQIVIMWRRLDSDDETAQYSQRIVLQCDGRPFINHESELDISKPLSRSIFNIGAVPVVESGTLTITAQVRTGSADWTHAASYPITLKLRRVEANESL